MESWQLVLLLNIVAFYITWSKLLEISGRQKDVEYAWKKEKEALLEEIEKYKRCLDVDRLE
jgi:hypothetical protein